MNNSRKIVGLYRIGLSCTKKSAIAQFHKQILFIHPTHNFLCNFKAFDTLNMAQKSITSFFKATPKKSIEPQEETTKDESSPSLKDKAAEELSPKANGNEKSNSKRRRSEDESQSPEPNKKKASTNSDQKKKSKRQRIESSESEPEVPKTEIKVEKSESPKTYDSPKTKKAKIKLEKSTPKRQSKEKNEGETPERKSPQDKNECETLKTPISAKDVITPKSKSKEKDKTPESTSKTNAKSSKSPAKRSTSPSEKVASDKSKENKTEKKIVTLSGFVKKENGVKETEDEKDSEKVKEEDYNPAKPKYHPINDACWSKGQPIPYLALAKTLEEIEAISARLKIIEILSNYFRSVIALTPEDLLPSVYMCLNQLAPAYHSLELGIAETYIMKAIGQCTGRTLAQVKSAAQKTGDLGLVAEQARATQRTMFTPPPLKLRQVFSVLKEVANMTGQASVNKKISKIQTLYIACRHSEARYLIRSLEGKLRIGLAEQSVLQALALATTMTPPGIFIETLDASKGLTAEQFKEKVDKQALIIKTTYCECPNYDMIIPALLEHGVAALPDHCKLTPGIPLKPMLAHPTKGLNEVFNRFENQQFTCEWKYDGERAQIHVPGVMFPDYVHSAIFSRNQENNTTKYPDILKRLPKLLKEDVNSCVLDTEAVAYDVEKKQILPFQILSTRKRKDAVEAEIKVQVCVFVFDLLFLNGRALVREPLAVRRELLRKHFNEVEGEWHFATSKDCTSMEEVQVFLDESIRGSCEGLMVKMLQGENARYDIARRSHNWLKLKKDYLDGVGDTIDAVIIGAYAGKGKRAGVYGGFLLACADSSGEEYQTLCKIGTGFSDEDLKTLTELLKQHVIDSPKSYYRFDGSHAADVWLAPACVAEVRCADLSLSPAHRAAIGLVDPDKGISLRFPRFIRIRDDKTPEQATSSQQIAEMYLSQDQVKNTGTKVTNYDDFY